MKILCDCGNEAVFCTKNEETGEENRVDELEGQYATLKPDTFRFWEAHDQVGIVCENCNRSIWLFT